MRKYLAQHPQERQAYTADDGGGLLGPGQQQTEYAQQDDAHTHAPQPEAFDHQHAQWGADGQRTIAGDAVPGDDLGRVCGTHPANAPADRARAYQAFGAAQHQATGQQASQAQPG
ncbi:hypothetical protein D3C80_1506320 [compost metagenome]